MKKFAVIGHPIQHSKSPALHEAGFQEMNLDASFEKINLISADLEKWIKEEAPNYHGVAVTAPHKEMVMELCHKVSPAAEAIGAVNTLYWEDHILCGTNTDCLGALRAIESVSKKIRDKRVLVLGAGGASRALIYALKTAGCQLSVWNRTLEKAVSVADEFGINAVEHFDTINPDNFDIVCNTTCVGLKSWESLLPAEFWQPHHLAFDMVYDPLETRFLAEAGEADAEVVTGDFMLIHQAVEQFKLWHGIELESEVMHRGFFDRI